MVEIPVRIAEDSANFKKKAITETKTAPKTEDSNFFGNDPQDPKPETKFSDVMPYPQFFIGFAFGALAIAYASNWYFESKY